MNSVAEWISILVGIYLALGIVFAIAFSIRGIRKIDPGTEGGSWGFRLIILPGVVGLWPFLAKRWLTGVTEPPEEDNPHRIAA